MYTLQILKPKSLDSLLLDTFFVCTCQMLLFGLKNIYNPKTQYIFLNVQELYEKNVGGDHFYVGIQQLYRPLIMSSLQHGAQGFILKLSHDCYYFNPFNPITCRTDAWQGYSRTQDKTFFFSLGLDMERIESPHVPFWTKSPLSVLETQQDVSSELKS